METPTVHLILFPLPTWRAHIFLLKNSSSLMVIIHSQLCISISGAIAVAGKVYFIGNDGPVNYSDWMTIPWQLGRPWRIPVVFIKTAAFFNQFFFSFFGKLYIYLFILLFIILLLGVAPLSKALTVDNLTIVMVLTQLPLFQFVNQKFIFSARGIFHVKQPDKILILSQNQHSRKLLK